MQPHLVHGDEAMNGAGTGTLWMARKQPSQLAHCYTRWSREVRHPNDGCERCVVLDGACDREFIRIIKNTIVFPYTFMHKKEALARDT